MRFSRYGTHRHNFEIQKVIAVELESCINLVPLMPDEVKTFRGSLVLDLRI